MANSVDPDETARDEPSHLDLHCLHKYQFWSTNLIGLTAFRCVLFVFIGAWIRAFVFLELK